MLPVLARKVFNYNNKLKKEEAFRRHFNDSYMISARLQQDIYTSSPKKILAGHRGELLEVARLPFFEMSLTSGTNHHTICPFGYCRKQQTLYLPECI